jgi:mono/diheme cytochrome c family protein
VERSQRGRGVRRTQPLAAVIAGLAALAVVALAGPLSGGAGAAADEGKAVFDSLCQGCHTIGGGKLAGPDLQGLADRRERDWVKRFILAPDQVIGSGDPIAKQLVGEYGSQMPNLGVTETQVEQLLSFFGYAAPAPSPSPSPQPTPTPEPTPAAGDADRGKRLFKGDERFDAGGPSCLSCHSVAGVGALGGGQLGPDLTGAFDKYGGEQGLRSVLETVPFPTMAPIFGRKGLTTGEQADLVAFLATAPDQERPARAAGKLVGFSSAAAAVMVVVGLAVWRRRLTGVRKPLVNRSREK